MVKILLLIGALCSMTVTSTDGTVTLPQKTFKVQQGRDFRVSCEVTGEDFLYWSTPSKPARPGVAAIPSVNIQNGQTIDRRSVKVTGNTYELTIKDVSVQDGGNYVCQGSIGSAVFILEVDFEIGGVQKKQTLKIGEKGTIVLDVPAFPSPTYEWVKDGQEVTFPDPSGRRSLDSYTGSIVITQVQKSDEGNYSCEVTLGTGDTAHIEVTVVEMPKINKAKGNPVSRRLTQGFNATFLCDVESGYPKPNIEWWFEWSGKVKQVEVIHYPRYTHPTPNAWTITNIQPEDAGKYRCIATNEAGEDVQLFEITSVDVPPTIDPIDDIIANEGNRVELTCSVTGTPTPTVEWYYLGSYYFNFNSANSALSSLPRRFRGAPAMALWASQASQPAYLGQLGGASAVPVEGRLLEGHTSPRPVEGQLLDSRPSARPDASPTVRSGARRVANSEPFELVDELYRLNSPVKKFPPLQFPSDRVRDGIRDGTKKKVAKELGLQHFGQPVSPGALVPVHSRQVFLFSDEGVNAAGHGATNGGGDYLMGRFEVLSVVATADYDENWRFVRSNTSDAAKKPFWVLHAAAINIGETERATDYQDYANEMGKLELIHYIEDMGRIYDNILQSAEKLGVTSLVFFPFGMGAFLRNLYKLDADYSEANLHGQRLKELRHALAKRFVKAVSDSTVERVHLCIAPSGKGDELDANATAFLTEMLLSIKSGQLKPRVMEVLLNADALSTAQRLADDNRCVGLVNGANRRMVGNHWFSYGARMAIDENLHRRSWRMASTAYLLNGGAEAVRRHPGELAARVKGLGGKVIPLQTTNDSSDAKGEVLKQFRKWDTSGDGRISKDEMCKVLLAVGIAQKDCDIIFSAADSNKDGFLSYHEFVYWLLGGQSPPSLTPVRV